jgi:hypothetical protein
MTGNKIFFVEFKSDKGRLKPGQHLLINLLRGSGWVVLVGSDPKQLITEIKKIEGNL